MQVAHIIKVTGVAGAERHLLMLLSGLRARHIDARFILLVEPDNPVDEMVAAAEERGIPVERVVIKAHYDIGVVRRLMHLLRQWKPTIVHTHLIHADLFGIPAARLARVPVVITGRHNDDAFRRQPLLRLINAVLWRLVSGGIVISDSIRRFSINVEAAPPSKVHVIHYGTEHEWVPDADIQAARRALREELGLPLNTPIIGMVNRLTEQKGVSYGLQAFAKIAPMFPNMHLVIAGDGPLRGKLETETRKLVISDEVHFLGWRTDAGEIMAALDIFLMPSLWEGFGMVLLEAMARRVPVIASKVSAIPEVVTNGGTGFLVPPRNPEALAQAIYSMMMDDPARKFMGLMGEDRLTTHFGVSRMITETIDVYRLLAEGINHTDATPQSLKPTLNDEQKQPAKP